MTHDVDLIVRNGLIVDGTGNAPRRAAVAVSGGSIAAVGAITARARNAPTSAPPGRLVRGPQPAVH